MEKELNKTWIDCILEKNPKLNRSRLESFNPGAYCWHDCWGVGCIQMIDEAVHRFIIHFDSQTEPRSMDIAFGLQKLQPLEEGNIILESWKHPEEIQALIKKNPSALVIRVLESCKDSQCSGFQLQSILMKVTSRFLDLPQFKRWWVALQKKLARDPMIHVPQSTKDAYALRSEPYAHEQSLCHAFQAEQNASRKLEIALELKACGDLEQVHSELPQIIEGLQQILKTPSALLPSQRLQAIWARNDLAHCIDPNAQELEPTERSVVPTGNAAAEMMEGLSNADCNRCLQVLMEIDPTGWQQAVLTLLKRGKATCINFCIDALCANGHATLLQTTLERWLQEQQIPSALLIWILKHRMDPNHQALLKPLLNMRLLHCMLQTIGSEAVYLKPGRLIPLAKEIGNDKALLHDLLQGTPLELAKEVANLLRLNRGLSDAQRQTLMSRLMDLFPALKKSFKQEQPQEDIIWVSQSSLDAAQAEYDALVKEKIPANTDAIEKARALGDLSENAEYKMAKQDQLVLLARKNMLEDTINHCRVIDLTTVRTDKVGIGTSIVLQEGNELHTYTILGALDSDSNNGIVSYKTPFAQTLLGKKVDDKVTLPNGEEAVIHSIQRCKI